jgi:uncharacterized protein
MRESMIKIIRQSDYKEGLWRNGQGVSWEIAAHKDEGAADFSWRFAKARIDNNVPFSIYPGMDRIFMMLEGGGMDLEFEEGKILEVHEKWVPHEFSCDIPLNCKLLDGPSLDLNLFVDREKFRISAEILKLNSVQQTISSPHLTIIFSLLGQCQFDEATLGCGDTAIVNTTEQVRSDKDFSIIFVGKISRL